MTQPPLISVVTVCLDPGPDLEKTVNSVLGQDFLDFEYLIKDGGSGDGSRRYVPHDRRVKFTSSPDRGIYDAMNQALASCRGEYVNFLNAGDTFRLPTLLSSVAETVEATAFPDIVYVDRYNEELGLVTRYPPSLTHWYLFRRPVCHQVQFVKRDLLLTMGGFDTAYEILADYDMLLKLVLNAGARHARCPLVGVNYKDGGVSSAPGNSSRKARELKRLRGTYFSRLERLLYGIAWHATLPRVRIRLQRWRPLAELRRRRHFQ